MKTSKILIIIGIAALAGLFLFFGREKEPSVAPEQTFNIAGCYVAGTEKDIYTLNIRGVEGENVSGNLSFKNFEKDSSSGTFAGTYKDGILLGDYAFSSEGANSVMQVIFKRSSDDFIRGYGEVKEDGTRFTDISTINYDSSSALNVFKKRPCPEEAGSSYETYYNSDLGIEFKYKTGPEGYYLTEHSSSELEKMGVVKTINLHREIDRAYLEEIEKAGGEGQPGMYIRVVKNNKKQSSAVWTVENEYLSNIDLKTSEPTEYVVGGANAVRYPLDGLYYSENIIVAHGENIYILNSDGYPKKDSTPYKDFQPLVDSVRFIPKEGQM